MEKKKEEVKTRHGQPLKDNETISYKGKRKFELTPDEFQEISDRKFCEKHNFCYNCGARQIKIDKLVKRDGFQNFWRGFQRKALRMKLNPFHVLMMRTNKGFEVLEYYNVDRFLEHAEGLYDVVPEAIMSSDLGSRMVMFHKGVKYPIKPLDLHIDNLDNEKLKASQGKLEFLGNAELAYLTVRGSHIKDIFKTQGANQDIVKTIIIIIVIFAVVLVGMSIWG